MIFFFSKHSVSIGNYFGPISSSSCYNQRSDMLKLKKRSRCIIFIDKVEFNVLEWIELREPGSVKMSYLI